MHLLPASEPLALTQSKSKEIATVSATTNVTAPSTTRFVGKHAKDQKLSIFIQKRNINEFQGTGEVEEILGLVRISPEAYRSIVQKGAVVMIGVMARLLSDYGLQFAENFVYQSETAIFPNDSLRGNEVFEMIGEGGCLGDAVLPDEFHRGFRLRLPAHLPPSTIFLSPDTSNGPGLVGDSPWGLTYYIYAYINHAPSSSGSALTAPFAPYASSSSGRKSSKVFLSFTKSLVSDSETILRERTAPAQSVSKTLMPSSKPISLDAALERPFYSANDVMSVHVKIDNPRAATLGGLRITLKQLITTRCLNEAKHVTKLPLAVYEFPLVDANGKFIASNSGSMGSNSTLKDYPFVIDTVRVQLKPGNFLQQVAVESRLPRSIMRELILAPSFEQSYDFGNSNLRYFSIQYYMNVHVIVPWGSNLIAKLPFTVASRGASESLSAADNLTSLCAQDAAGVVDEFEDEDLSRAQTAFSAKAKTTAPVEPVESLQRALEIFPKERLWREFDASLRLLDSFKSLNVRQQHLKSVSAFEASRRTWTRELAEAGNEISAKIDTLAGLVCVTDASIGQVTGAVPCAMHASAPKDLLDALKTRFLPAYFKLVACHEEPEHREAMQEAFNLLLDTLELVYMKFHLSLPQPVNAASGTKGAVFEVDSDFSGDQLLALIRGRLTRDFTRLILVIPGLVEWRWLLEGLLTGALQFGAGQWRSEWPLELSDAMLYSAVEDEEDLNYLLATTFQGIHDRLAQSFTDAQITPAEIVRYGQLLATLLRTKSDAKAAHVAAAHYSYFKVALFVYFGAFGALMLPFDAAIVPPIGPSGGQLKELREQLNVLRAALIESMQQ